MSYQQKIDAATQRVAAARALGELSQGPSPESGSATTNQKTSASALTEVAATTASVAGSGLIAVFAVFLFFIIALMVGLLRHL